MNMEVLISKLNKLLQLLEEDEIMIGRGMEGEILEDYRKTINMEKASVLEMLKKVYQIIY